MTEKGRLALFFTFWLLIMGFMTAKIERHLFTGKTESSSKDPIYMLLGSAKEAIGDTFFLKASSYFHGGVDTDLIEREEAFGEEQDHIESGHLNETYKKSGRDWIYNINSQTKVMEHRHLEGEDVKELMPFLKAAVTLDPYNVPAILTTAYWLNDDLKKTDASIEVLKRGLKDNPGSWEIAYQLGLIYFKTKKDGATGIAYFNESLNKMRSDNSNAVDHRTAYFYLGEAYLKQGMKREGLDSLKKALSYFADSEDVPIKSRIINEIRGLTI